MAEAWSYTAPPLDIRGECCLGNNTLDACGICAGSARFVDALGRCCSTQLDAQGICCNEAETLDICGVCGGGGFSCALEVTLITRGIDVNSWRYPIDIVDAEAAEVEEVDPNQYAVVKKWNEWMLRTLQLPATERGRIVVIEANETVVLRNESALCQVQKERLCNKYRPENVLFCALKEDQLCLDSEASAVPFFAQHIDAGLLTTFCDETEYFNSQTNRTVISHTLT